MLDTTDARLKQYDAAMTLLIRARKLWATIEVHVGKWWEMVGNGWNFNFTWPHLAIQNNKSNYTVSSFQMRFLDFWTSGFLAASLRPQAALRGNGRMFNR